MKVSTLYAGLANGLGSALESLDNQVMKLNPQKIYSMTDGVLVDPHAPYRTLHGLVPVFDTAITRVLVYD